MIRKNALKYWISGAMVIGLVWFGVTAFNQSLTPYRTFAEARAAGSYVQVSGALSDPEATRVDGGVLRFRLKDEAGEEMPVHYHGAKPANFEQATSIVAMGEYKDGAFEADRLLVKCPSKYQAEGGDGFVDADEAPRDSARARGPDPRSTY